MATKTFTSKMLYGQRGEGTRGVPEIPGGSSWDGDLYSLDFDGIEDGIKLDNTENNTDFNFGFDDSFSISCWAKTSNAGYKMLVTKWAYVSWSGVPPEGSLGWWFGFSSNALTFSLNATIWGSGGNAGIHNSMSGFQAWKLANVWHHYLVTYNGNRLGSGIKLYIDSIDVSGAGITNMDPSYVVNTTSSVYIGDRDTTSPGNELTHASWLGNIDEVAIWEGTVLDQTQIDTIYNGTPPAGAVSPGWDWSGGTGTPDDLSSLNPSSWWRMGDKGTFSTNWALPDQGSNSYNGTSENMIVGDREEDIPPT
jgi:hypothetical protein